MSILVSLVSLDVWTESWWHGVSKTILACINMDFQEICEHHILETTVCYWLPSMLWQMHAKCSTMIFIYVFIVYTTLCTPLLLHTLKNHVVICRYHLVHFFHYKPMPITWLFLSSGFTSPCVDSSAGFLSKLQKELMGIERVSACSLILDFLDCNHSFNPTPSVAPHWQIKVKGAGHFSLFFWSYFCASETPNLLIRLYRLKTMYLVLTLTLSHYAMSTIQCNRKLSMVVCLQRGETAVKLLLALVGLLTEGGFFFSNKVLWNQWMQTHCQGFNVLCPGLGLGARI